MRRIDLRTAVIVLILANLPTWIVIFFTVDQAKTAIEEEVAANFRAISGNNAATMSYAVNNLVREVETLAVNAAVQAAIVAGNASYPRSPDAVRRKITAIEQAWLQPRGEATVQRILSNPASRYLRGFVAINPAFRRITVTDRFGGTVAANVKPIDFEQGDEPWWRQSFRDGVTGQVVIEDVRFDPLTQINVLHIVVPVANKSPEEVIGVIGVAVDISDLFLLVTGTPIGATGNMSLAREDGTIIGSEVVDFPPAQTGDPTSTESEDSGHLVAAQLMEVPYFDEILNALRQPGQPDFIEATALGGGRKMVAFRKLALSSKYPQLRWISIVEQDMSETHIAVDTMNRHLLLAALGILVVTIGLAIYLATHGKMEVTDIAETKEG
ncbi:MAG: cache domain-containing protein [Acidobacteriota bacterium]|nr:cache domain-containing protein [Acidobacteriota bacterium]